MLRVLMLSVSVVVAVEVEEGVGEGYCKVAVSRDGGTRRLNGPGMGGAGVEVDVDLDCGGRVQPMHRPWWEEKIAGVI